MYGCQIKCKYYTTFRCHFKYLVQYILLLPAKKNGCAGVTGARVLTSNELYAILHKKEEKEKGEQRKEKSKKGKIRISKRIGCVRKGKETSVKETKSQMTKNQRIQQVL